jgi:Fe2+ transport system protein FeoA
MTTKPLSEISPGLKGRIAGIDLTGNVRRHLSDMGMVVGSEIQMERTAPLGDPIEIKIKGYALTLRKETASRITIEMDIVPLDMIEAGKHAWVAGHLGGDNLAHKTAELGISKGATIEMLENRGHGPLRLILNEAPLEIGRGMAQKILVKEL